MKKVYFAALLSITMMTANAQEPNIPMFGNQQKIDVNPLLDKYDKTQNTLIKQFDALGLTAKGKGRNGTSDADDDDPVLAALTNR
jgi:hypothetical protein